jgi:phage recombination protein Bet
MNETALTVTSEVTEQKIIEYLDAQGMTKKLSDEEKIMFIRTAQSFGLNPFKREIHITAYGSGDYRNVSIITGYDVYIKRAERTGKLDGWKCWIEGNGNDMKAVLEIYRKDQSHPFQHEAYYSEAVQMTKEGRPNRTWAKMPKFMLKKVVIGQGFRLCFPDDMGGMPYEEAEIPFHEDNELKNVTPGTGSNGNDHPPPPSENVKQENPQEQARRKIDPLVIRRKELGKELITIMIAQDPDECDYFTDEEKQLVKGILEQCRPDPQGIAVVEGAIKKWGEEMKRRETAFKPVPFSDEGGTREARGEDGFEDDIPWGKPSGKTTGANGELDIY